MCVLLYVVHVSADFGFRPHNQGRFEEARVSLMFMSSLSGLFIVSSSVTQNILKIT